MSSRPGDAALEIHPSCFFLYSYISIGNLIIIDYTGPILSRHIVTWGLVPQKYLWREDPL